MPVYAERGRYGGIALLPGYRTTSPASTSPTRHAPSSCSPPTTRTPRCGLDAALGSALRKVMAALPAPHRPAAEQTRPRLVDPGPLCNGARAAVDVAELHDAVLADVRLRLAALPAQRAGRTAPVHRRPLRPRREAGVWYLVADLDGDPRLFRADRIHTAEPADDPVRRRAGAELADVWEALRAGVGGAASADAAGAGAPPAPGTVPAAERAAADREPRPDEPRPGERPGEWLLAEPPCRGRLGAVLLAFGPTVEVLDPPEAAHLLAEVAAEVVGLYGGEGAAGPQGP
ncbi:YafY family transcriptional regulator [Streptomyces californicus]